jgi:hypothetical protein
MGVLLSCCPEMKDPDRLAAMLALASAFSTSLSMIGLNRLGGVDARRRHALLGRRDHRHVRLLVADRRAG